MGLSATYLFWKFGNDDKSRINGNGGNTGTDGTGKTGGTNSASDSNNTSAITAQLDELLQNVRKAKVDISTKINDLFNKMCNKDVPTSPSQADSEFYDAEGNFDEAKFNQAELKYKEAEAIYKQECQDIQNQIKELKAQLENLTETEKNLDNAKANASNLSDEDIASLKEMVDKAINDINGAQESSETTSVDVNNEAGNNTKNISSQELEDLYIAYLTAGCGGKNQVLTKGILMKLEDGITPEQKAEEIIAKYLEDNNITNISSKEIMELFAKIDERMQSVHSWADRKGGYDEKMLSDMRAIVKSFCVVEAGIKALTEDNWNELVDIFDANKEDEDKQFYAINDYLKNINSELLAGDILSKIEEKSKAKSETNEAISTDKIKIELDAIKKIIDDNVKNNPFKTFSG